MGALLRVPYRRHVGYGTFVPSRIRSTLWQATEGGIVGFFSKKDEPPQHPSPSPSDDPVASLLATYNPNAELSLIEAADLGAKLQAIHERNRRNNDIDGRLYSILRRLQLEASFVRGKPCGDWIPTLNELRSSGDDDTALPLLLECIEAAERTARVTGMEPAPAFTRRAAVICRRRKDYAQEIRVLKRWEAAAPRRYKGAMADRIAAAMKLRDKDH